MKITVTKQTTGGIVEITGRKDYTASGYSYIEATTVATGVSNQVFDIGIVLAQVAVLVLLATVDMTVTPYKGAVGGTPIALKANVPYEWTTDSYDAIKLGDDVTSFKVSNASGTDGSFSAECLYAPTPA